MQHLFIIGNGFDLAHGLKTSYNSFIEDYLLKTTIDTGLITTKYNRNPNYYEITYKLGINKSIYTKNKFLAELLYRYNKNKKNNVNWVDIERYYFECLTRNNEDITRLNTEFKILKNELEKYLTDINDKKLDPTLYHFFDTFSKEKSDEITVLNFNYTNTFERLYDGIFNQTTIVNIHGVLNKKDNPIVFGYAPTDDETMNLIDQENNELLKNIKKYYYKRTSSETVLNSFLSSYDKNTNVHILGHSCGVSDRNILNTISTHTLVGETSIMYYNNYDNYFDTLVNIDRIVGRNKHYGIMTNFDKCIRIPQYNDSHSKNIDTNKMIEDLLVTKPFEELSF